MSFCGDSISDHQISILSAKCSLLHHCPVLSGCDPTSLIMNNGFLNKTAGISFSNLMILEILEGGGTVFKLSEQNPIPPMNQEVECKAVLSRPLGRKSP
jgi:hypothetical protein